VDSYTKKLVDAFGFETTRKTRPLIIDGLKDIVKHAAETIYDPDTLGEMLTFVYDERRRGQAEEGKHDDLVMSLAIAHFIRSQQTTAPVPSDHHRPAESGTQTAWTEDMLKDFNRAGPQQRKEMIRMWGPPRR
jgi:phage terminase large subunit